MRSLLMKYRRPSRTGISVSGITVPARESVAAITKVPVEYCHVSRVRELLVVLSCELSLTDNGMTAKRLGRAAAELQRNCTERLTPAPAITASCLVVRHSTCPRAGSPGPWPRLALLALPAEWNLGGIWGPAHNAIRRADVHNKCVKTSLLL